MKPRLGAIVLAALAAAPWRVDGLASDLARPLTKTIELLERLKAKIEEEGKTEAESYDKFSCWCEETLEVKAKEVNAAKEKIEELQNTVIKLGGTLAGKKVDGEYMEKNLASGKASLEEAVAVREKEKAAYEEQKTESEQALGALEQAIKVLSEIGGKKEEGEEKTEESLLRKKSKPRLGTLQQAQLLSAAAGVRGLLRFAAMQRVLSAQDLELIRRFVEAPAELVGGMGFLQAKGKGKGIFGDYSTQSGQILGILKQMQEDITKQLAKDEEEEAAKAKAYEELTATKKEELDNLESSLTDLEEKHGDESKELAEARTELADVKDELAATEEFFGNAAGSCRAKASEWQERTRLRTEELQGVKKAIEILTSPEALAAGANGTEAGAPAPAAAMFLQVDSARPHKHKHLGLVARKTEKAAYKALSALAAKYKSLNLAKVAAEVRVSGGHFDKVISIIDKLILELKEEEQDDKEQRDYCLKEEAKNKADKEALEKELEKLNQTIELEMDEEARMVEDLNVTDAKINETKTEMAETAEQRAKDKADFHDEKTADMVIVMMLNDAIDVLQSFYKNNKLPLELAQQAAGSPAAAPGPAAAADTGPPPETAWSGEYTGHKEGGGVIGVLEMLRDGIKEDMKLAEQQDASADIVWAKGAKAAKDMLDSQEEVRNTQSRELVAHRTKMLHTEKDQEEAEGDLEEVEKVGETLAKECAWVAKHFEQRLADRRGEIEGLKQAKHILMGAAADAAMEG